MIQGNACKINKLIINKLIIDANLMIQSTISLLDKNDRELANVSNIIIPSTETLNKIEELFKCIELDAAKEIFEEYDPIEQEGVPEYQLRTDPSDPDYF